MIVFSEDKESDCWSETNDLHKEKQVDRQTDIQIRR